MWGARGCKFQETRKGPMRGENTRFERSSKGNKMCVIVKTLRAEGLGQERDAGMKVVPGNGTKNTP